MKYYLLLAVCLLSLTAISQQNTIATTFADNGEIHKSLDDNSQVIENFRSNESCVVLAYQGNNFYKVSYNKVIGYVGDEYLTVNGKMMELYYDYQNKATQAQATTASESKLEKSIKAKELALKEKYDKLKQKLEAKLTKEAQKRRDDSIAKINELAKEAQLRKNEQERIDRERRDDSIARVNEQMRLKILYENEQHRKRAIFVADSIAKAEKELRIQQRLAEKKAKELEKQQTAKAIAARTEKENKELSKALEEARKEIEALKQAKLSGGASKTSSTGNSLCKYEVNTTDKALGAVIKTELYNVAQHVDVQLAKQGARTQVLFNVKVNVAKHIGCASSKPDTRSYAKVTLENDQVVSLYHSGDQACDVFELKASMSNSKMTALKQSPIKYIEIKGTKTGVKFENIVNKTFFVDMLSCID